MSDDAGRRRIGNPRRNARPRTRAQRVGEPNVLSNAAIPNTLSTMGARPASLPASMRGVAAESTPGWLSTGERAPARRVALPSFGTLIFLVFLAFTGFRLIGEFVRGLGEDAPSPTTPTTPAGPNRAIVPGSIIFGVASDGECGVLGTAHEFAAGSEVWWSAQLASEQRADAEVVVIVRRDGIEVDRAAIPPDESYGTWDFACSIKPVPQTRPGLYQVEIWDARVSTRHAIGEYRLTPA